MFRRWPLVFLLLLAFTVRLYRLDGQSIWSDEGLSLHRASQSVAFILSNQIVTQGVPSQDPHPPLYFLVLHGFMLGAGRSEFAVKFLSVVFSLLIIPLLYVAGRRLLSSAAGGLAALLGAISPLYLWYAQEIRMYTMLVALGLLSVYALLRVQAALAEATQSRQEVWRWSAAYVIATTATLYTHYSGFFLLGFQALVLGGLLLRRRPAWLVVLVAVAALLAIPLMPIALQRLQVEAEAGYKFVPLFVILQDLLNAFSLGISVEFSQVVALDLVYLATFLLGLLALARDGRRGVTRPLTRLHAERDEHLIKREAGVQARHLFLAGYLLVPTLILYLFSYVKPMYMGVRHLIVVSPAFYLGLAAGLVALRDRWRPAALAVLAVFLLGAGYSTHNAFFDEAYLKDDLRSLVRYLEQHAHSGDVILLRDPVIAHVFEYYYQGDVPWMALPGYGQVAGPETIETLKGLVNQYERIWSVYGPPGFFADPEGLVKAWLDDHLFKVDNASFHGYGTNVATAAYLTTRPIFDQAPAVPQPVEVNLAGRLRLLGYGLRNNPVVAGTTTPISLYWHVLQSLGENYRIAVSLVDEQGHTWGMGDSPPFNGLHPTSGWKVGEFVRLEHEVVVLPGTPPGSYRLVLKVYHTDSNEALDVLDAEDNPKGKSVDLGTVNVARPSHPISLRAIAPQHRLQVDWASGLRLLGYDLVPEALSPGQAVPLAVYWQARRPVERDYHLRLALVDPAGQLRAEVTVLPVGAGYPPTRWPPGDVLMGQHELLVPPDAPSGPYTLYLSLVDPVDGTLVPARRGLWPFGVKRVSLPAPQVVEVTRLSTPPPMEYGVGVRLGGMVELVGYDCDPETVRPGGSLAVTLYWRAGTRLLESYKVTVQVLSAEGRLVAQEDSVPANWTRPTTGWLPGEVVMDPHRVPIPADAAPGRYTLITALYSQTTSQRLLTDDTAEDHVVLGEIEVQRSP